MVVADRVIVEIKATKAISEADERQLLNYLKASKYEIGLLLHFGPEKGKHRRFVYSNASK